MPSLRWISPIRQIHHFGYPAVFRRYTAIMCYRLLDSHDPMFTPYCNGWVSPDYDDSDLFVSESISPVRRSSHGPLARCVKLRVAHAPGMPGTLSPPLRVSDPDMHHGTCVTHVPWCMPGSVTSCFLWSRWRGKLSRCMRSPQFYASGKRLIISRELHWSNVNIQLSAFIMWSDLTLYCTQNYSNLERTNSRSCTRKRHTILVPTGEQWGVCCEYFCKKMTAL